MKSIVGFDGEHFFCKGCGRTFTSKMGVLGHQKNCEKRKFENVTMVDVPKESHEYLGNVDAKHRIEHREQRTTYDAQSVAHDAQLHQQLILPQGFICDVKNNPIKVPETSEQLCSMMIQRIYSLEQFCKESQKKNQELERYIYNDKTHVNALANVNNESVTANYVKVGIYCGILGIALGYLFSSGKGDPENMGKRIANKAVDRGISKVVDNFVSKIV